MTHRPVHDPRRVASSVALAAALAASVTPGAALHLSVPPARAATAAEAAADGAVPDPAPTHAQLGIDSVTPDVVDPQTDPATPTVAGPSSAVAGSTGGVPTVTVTGTLRNVGAEALTSVDVRLQRAPRVADGASVREPLTWTEPSFQVRGAFQRVAARVEPGQAVPFRLTMPVASPGATAGAPAEPDLQITEPGVYPLLVNVNGTPEGAGPARLADARTLLPVLSTPWRQTPTNPTSPGNSTSTPVAPPRPTPVPVTVLLPLSSASVPRTHVPGKDGVDPVVSLSDAGLAAELGADGRLTGLLDAAEAAFSGRGGVQLRDATCLAVDPALLDAVQGLAAGRRLVAPDAEGVDTGALAADATRWRDRLAALATGHCTTALPAAGADLSALARTQDPGLAATALDRGRALAVALGTEPVAGVAISPTGALTTSAAEGLALHDQAVVVADTATRTATGRVPDPGVVTLAGTTNLRALTFPADLGAALAATGEHPENPTYLAPDQRYWLGADTPAARAQDARAALLAPLARAGTAPTSSTAPTGTAPTATPSQQTPADPGLFVVPPAVWGADRETASSLLGVLGGALATGRMQAQPLTTRLAQPPVATDGMLALSPTGAADPGRLDEATVDAVRAGLPELATLRRLVDPADPRAADAAAHLDPLADSALGALTATGRREGGDGLTPEDVTGAPRRARAASDAEAFREGTRAALREVDLMPPGSVFTMAGPNSPLLMVVRNGLPFPIRTRLDASADSGLDVGSVADLQVPAAGSRTVQLPTDATSDDSGRRRVTFALRTLDGRLLGDEVTVSVQSGGYPLALGFTLVAAALALVLVGRRYLRYRRGTPDPSDDGHRPEQGDRP